jgi:beta-galactosidase
VRLPHNAVDLEMTTTSTSAASKKSSATSTRSTWQPEFAGREISLVFDGAMADSVVWVNGRQVAAHKDGYTPFEMRA